MGNIISKYRHVMYLFLILSWIGCGSPSIDIAKNKTKRIEFIEYASIHPPLISIIKVDGEEYLVAHGGGIIPLVKNDNHE